MIVVTHAETALEDAWIEGQEGARWRSAAGHGPGTGAVGSGSSLLEVAPGCHLARHTDSAEEVVVVVAGTATLSVGDETANVPAGGAAVVPKGMPHEVHNDGRDVLRFLAVYAEPEVVTRYEAPVQPGGEAERRPVA
jgi:quercetin dioxygenase-like cupin family protein